MEISIHIKLKGDMHDPQLIYELLQSFSPKECSRLVCLSVDERLSLAEQVTVIRSE